jgi:hypothetical protein
LDLFFLNAYNRFYLFNVLYSDNYWTSSAYPLSFWLTNIYTLLVWGYLSPTIIYILVVIVSIIRTIGKLLISSGTYTIELISSDNMGGFKPLSNLALSMMYISIPFQIQLSVYPFWIKAINIPFFIGTLVVFFITILVFFIPIYTAHCVMSTTKVNAIRLVAEKVNALYHLIMRELASNSQADVSQNQTEHLNHKNLVIQIDEYSKLINYLKYTTTWPFNTNVIIKFIIVAVVPITMTIISTLLKKYM